MSFFGKLHELSFYGLLAAIFCLTSDLTTVSELITFGFHVNNFTSFFQAYLFWASVLFIPISVICAFATKYGDDGEGLTFNSDNLFVIMFAHMAEDILGLLLSIFWLLKDLFTRNLDAWKVIDYITFFLQILIIIVGIGLI